MRHLFFCLLFAFSTGALNTALADCPTDRIDETATVSFIADGDTVKLDSGEWVRFIAINTPEKGRKGRKDEPLANAARLALQELIEGQAMKISLRYGSDKRDRHGRLLAHAFLPDGTNISEELIADGLGFHIVVPPNDWGYNCYQAAERQAHNEQKGIWKEAWYDPRDSRSMDKSAGGFMRVRGKVVRVGKGRKTSWINLEGRVALKLAHRDRHAFGDFNPGDLVGKTITVRGWFYPSKSKYDDLRTNLRHPSAIESLN